MGTVSVKTERDGQMLVFDVDWSGSSVCGRGPDDEVPDIDDVRGWVETKAGEFVRDMTKEELERYGQDDTILGYVFEAIHEQYNEPDYDEPEYPS